MSREKPRPSPLMEMPDGVGHKLIDKAIEDWRAMETRYFEADVAQVAALNAADGARERDREAFASAMREGKSDPGAKIEEAAKAEVSRTRREAEAADIARHTARDELVAAIEEHRDEYDMKLAKAIEANRMSNGKLTERLSEGVAEGERMHALRHFLAHPGGRSRPRSAYNVGEALGALDATFTSETERVEQAKARIAAAPAMRGQQPMITSAEGKLVYLVEECGFPKRVAKRAIEELSAA